MTKIVCKEDCGNSPKMQMLKAWLTALAKAESDNVLAMLGEDVVWNIVGGERISGKSDYKNAIEKKMAADDIQELTIENILTHGKLGSANGFYTTVHGAQYAFCDVYAFSSAASNAKIKEITSYIIPIS